jgi:hypothetical protein
MASNRVNMDHMTRGSTHGSIRQFNTIITTAPNIVLNSPLVENHNEGFWVAKETQTRSNQKQYHILLAGKKKKTARESLLIWLYPTGAVTAIPIDQSKVIIPKRDSLMAELKHHHRTLTMSINYLSS